MIPVIISLFLTTSFWQGEECVADPQSFSEQTKQIMESAEEHEAAEPYKALFRNTFPDLDALTNEEIRTKFFENIPLYIQAALAKTYEAEVSSLTSDQINYPLLQEKLAAEFAKLKLIDDAASKDFFAASRDFYSQKGTDTKEESPEYKRLFEFYKSKGVPILHMRRMWNAGIKIVANQEFTKWMKEEEEKLSKNGITLEWKHIAESRFVNISGVTEDDLKLWIAGYYSIGTNEKPGVALRAQRATETYARLVYLDSDEILDDQYLKEKYKDEPELGEQIRKFQAEMKQKWEDELKVAKESIDQLNARFGEILDYSQLEERLRVRFKQKQAHEYIKHRQVFKPNALQIDFEKLEKMGITAILTNEEIEKIAAEQEIEGEVNYLLKAAEEQGKRLGELRAKDSRDQQLKELEIPLHENSRFQNMFSSIEKVALAYPQIVSLQTVKEEISEKLLEAERVSYTIHWIQKNAASSSAAEIEKWAKKEGLDEWIAMKKILEMAADVAQNQVVSDYLKQRYDVTFVQPNRSARESTFLLLQGNSPPIDFSRPVTTLSPVDWIKSKREEARTKHQALQARYPSLKVKNLDEKIDSHERYEMAIHWLPHNSDKPWKEVRAYLEKNGVFERADEKSVIQQYLYYKTNPLIRELLETVANGIYAGEEERPKYITRKIELMRQLNAVAEELPNDFEMDPVHELVAETSKQHRKANQDMLDEAAKQELLRIQEQGFWSKIWDVGMDTAEALHMTIGGVAGSAASIFAPSGVNWGADYIMWVHEHAKKHHNGSILGTTEDLSQASLAGLVLRTNPLVQAGTIFEPILAQTTKGYDAYVKWVYDANEDDLQALKKNNSLVRGGYYAFATAQGAAAIAATLATGGSAGMGTRGAQFLTKWGPRVGMKGTATALASSSRASVMVGQGLAAGRMIAVSGGMSFGTSLGYELIYADKENRKVDPEEILFNTYTSTAPSLVFSAGMGALAKAKATLDYRSKFKNTPPRMGPSKMNVEQQTAWNQMMKRASGQTNILDFIEGLSSVPESVDLLSEGFEHGMLSQRMIGAYLVTGANFIDLRDVSESLEGIKWTRPGVKLSPQIVPPPAVELLPRAELPSLSPEAQAPSEGAD